MNTKEITAALHKAAIGHLVKRRFSVYKELGIVAWGRRRVDLLGIKLSGQIIIMEVKASYADWRQDSKWQEYIRFANQFYLVTTETVYDKFKDTDIQKLKAAGAGLMILSSETGWVYVQINAKKRTITKEDQLSLALRLAWRGGEFSKRNTRRMRVYLE